jgi:hypothetical protein
MGFAWVGKKSVPKRVSPEKAEEPRSLPSEGKQKGVSVLLFAFLVPASSVPRLVALNHWKPVDAKDDE